MLIHMHKSHIQEKTEIIRLWAAYENRPQIDYDFLWEEVKFMEYQPKRSLIVSRACNHRPYTAVAKNISLTITPCSQSPS